ncbi:MAG: hypothetical protein ABW252_20590 [Polyangiales bacterium]
MSLRHAMLAALASVAAPFACTRVGHDAPPPLVRAPLPAPAPSDHGALCLDVGAVRACWDARAPLPCREGRCLVPRPPAPHALDAASLRCAGLGSARRCDERARDASAFACAGSTCVQERARAPDNAEWECAEVDGAMVCRRVAAAAGIPDGATDPAFVCGVRTRDGARVCVDFAPDRPPVFAGFRCTVAYAGGTRRRTCRASERLSVGDACTADAACPRDALCVEGRCLPPPPAPTCWLDADCADGARCRWGSCVGGS